MKRAFFAALVACSVAVAGDAGAETTAEDGQGAHGAASPVVVELFTSQGCSACPPADALLAEIAPRRDIIALSLHVDYWDYLGWSDIFAQSAFTDRQRGYARIAGERAVFTPQMIVAGATILPDVTPAVLEGAIAAAAAHPAAPVRLQVRRQGEALHVALSAEAGPLPDGTVVQLVRYLPNVRVDIPQGENAGRSFDYSNVVIAWNALGAWDGQGPRAFDVALKGPEPAVVIVQAARETPDGPLPGPILAAARVD
ncbi:DUF1223 domain-containing protein [Phaeovulum vinaykumarii]|uniref:DUF1223 domain-containing protein n=1 Tax=Phaeovulum vinaykumarii TaxID=407234 RepID=A0A1N7LX13_9RHOB|nr:DUF1223 domain-containing protein [Phaeovulum vinaykumarii]SIS78334.1 hypothetical protein SAMN05421795_104214 [Phaeovulum vinaykumarii]SOC07072.1 hypothetical protein SAMN05878426_10440 [Phaeovulum vinaykumarii]